MTLRHVRDLFEDRALDKTLLQRFLFFVVTALDVIHQAGIVHTGQCLQSIGYAKQRFWLRSNQDLSPNNILVGAGDSVVAEVEQVELSNPSPRKVLADRTIHLSYTMKTTFDPPVITDFGAARMGQPGQKHSGDVMPAPFRAPEVIAGMEWDSQIDIWSVGVMVRIGTTFTDDPCGRLLTRNPYPKIWNLLEDGNLFKPSRNGHLNDEQHFAQMVSLMGLPPREFLDRSDQCHKYWDSEGAIPAGLGTSSITSLSDD
ncbi:Dual specificity protein kinase pom1 [Teratosphaeria destructans]|uniref:Dual specificity protein kinase pom1 n=1 Tax=Teratosphaeria destructans TaxID=418781 RepID=A0A9W7SM77_9PEZI|nr:Dual specificity protein kinase pom1 [Teratosphaeria destructans]